MQYLVDAGLSLKAKGLLSLILLLPETENLSVAKLTTYSLDGRDGVTAAVRELEKAGYLTRQQQKASDGRVEGCEYVVKTPNTSKTVNAVNALKPLSNIYNIYTLSLSKGGVGGNLSLGQQAPTAENPAVAEDTAPHQPVAPGSPSPTSAPPLPKRTKCEERFDRFWAAYPRRVAKGAARKAFAKLNPNDELLDRMLTAIAAQRVSPDWTRNNGQYIPHPSTWINQERWDDEVTQSQPTPPSKGGINHDNWVFIPR